MKKTPCLYAIAHFTPFVETGEFANVGVVLIAPEQGFFDFRLLRKRYGRVTRFFDEIDRHVYSSTVATLKGELDRIKVLLDGRLFKEWMGSGEVAMALEIFQELIRPRETVMRFSEARNVLALDPAETLDKLYGFYVERNFVGAEYGEKLLEKQVRELLSEAHLDKYFHRQSVGDEAYRVGFPFVEAKNDKPIKLIKPLRLTHDDPSQIREHGLQWITKINELKRRHHLPEHVLFAVDEVQEDGSRKEACLEIEDRLKELEISVAQHTNADVILDFARL